MRRLFLRYVADESGASGVIVALCMVMLVGCLALVVDLGNSYFHKVKLQTAVDAATMSGGSLLPVSANSSSLSEVEQAVYDSLAANGFSRDEVDVDFTWGGNGTYDYQLRVTATTDVVYAFASVLGTTSGQVSATASVGAAPIASTRKAISVYITQSDFESQMSSMSTDTPFTITISSSGEVSTSTSNMGIMRIVTESDRSNYATFEGITSARDPEFFHYGYYGMTSAGEKQGLSVGEDRIIENNSSIYANAYTGMLARISDCASECGSGCSHASHSSSCPRIALLPVVSVSSSSSSSSSGGSSRGGSSGGGSSGGGTSNGTATVQYFVAIYVQSVTKTSSGTTITAYYLDDYREVSDVDESASYNINQFTVCTPVLAE